MVTIIFFLFQKNELGRTEIDPFWKSPNSAEPKFGRIPNTPPRLRCLTSNLGGVFVQVAFLKSPNSAEQLIRVNSGFGHFFQKKEKKSDLKKIIKK